MNKALRPCDFSSFESDPTKHPGLSLLAVYLFNLRKTLGYYGVNDAATWQLNSEQRDSVFNATNKPFEQFAERLSRIARELSMAADDKHTDGQEKAENLYKWARALITPDLRIVI
jgi:hypothetical protein